MDEPIPIPIPIPIPEFGLDLGILKSEVIRLATLDPLLYERERKPTSKRLGIRATALDGLVHALRPSPPAKKNGKANGHDHGSGAWLTPISEWIGDTPPDMPASLSESALALRFANLYGDRFRFVAELGKWLEWDGKKWGEDRILHIWRLAGKLCAIASNEAPQPSLGRALASAKTIAAVEKLSRSALPFPAVAEQFDADPWLLNTPDGIVDLRTGASVSSTPTAYCRSITAVGPGGACPNWIAFLDQITLGQIDLKAYLHRVAGYCLTGSTREHAMFFLYGTGGNGKGVFVRALSRIINDYAVNSPIETFTETPGNNQNHPTELARLRGKRLVTTTETEKGRRWAQARITELTGGDAISARFMRQDFFEFIPQFKLMVSGNNKPGLNDVDDAIRRRINLVPFNLKLSASTRNVELDNQLAREWPGILAWMIEGAKIYVEAGLSPPEIVKSATADYLADEDAVAVWIAEKCVTDVNLSTQSSRAFASWESWARANGESVGSAKRLSQGLEKRGFKIERTAIGSMVKGFSIRPSERAEAED